MGLVCDETVQSAICTASAALARRLEGMLLHWACSECVALSVEHIGQFRLPQDRNLKLLFLDMDSVEPAEDGRREKEAGGLIVISKDAGRAIRSYRWHPSAFLKPDFDARQLAGALTACEKYWTRARVCLESPYRRRAFRLPLGHIRYVEAAAHYCLFSHGRQLVRIRQATSELETLLPNPPFIRCHRSYLVHLDAVTGMSYTALTLSDGTQLPLGRTYIKPLREALQSWREGEMFDDDLHFDLRRSAGGTGEPAPDAPEL